MIVFLIQLQTSCAHCSQLKVFRQSVCDYIEENPMDHWFNLICEQDQAKHRNTEDPFRSYMKELRMHGWGGSFVVKMLAMMTDIPIRVWTSKPRIAGNNCDYDEFLVSDDDGTKPWLDMWIVIANETDLHFQSVGIIGDKRPGLCEDFN